jgi:2-C-methyl-D-erythritol 2,4-cyclodiphosphate synthase
MTQQQLPFRIGHGFDVHRFTEGSSIILGGVKIPHTRAFAAHSDGDVLIHAVCDALLGAVAAGDIGQHFPDTDAAYKDIDSCILLAKVYKLVTEAGYKLGNLDVTVVAQSPKIAPFIEQIRKRLCKELDTNLSQINIKATTTEKLGYVGREEGIAVHSVVILAAR